MSKATKAVIAVVIIILAVVVIAPKFIGTVAEKRVKVLAASMNKNNLPIKIVKFDKGWFSSKIEVQLNPGKAPIKLTLYQGPVIFHDGLTFAVAKVTTKQDFKPYTALITAKLLLTNGASIHVIGNTDSSRPFLPKSTTIDITVNNIKNFDKIYSHISINNMNGSDHATHASLKNFTLTVDANKINQTWTTIAGAQANNLKVVVPSIVTTSLDRVEIQGLTLKPQALLKAYLTLKYTRNPMTAAKIVLNQVKQIITRKTEASIINLHVDSSQGNGSYNFGLSWPNLPKSPSAVDYLKYVNLHSTLSIPSIKVLTGQLNFAMKELLFKINFKENYSSNLKFAINSIDFKKERHSASLRNMQYTVYAKPPANELQSVFIKFVMDQFCANKYCLKGTEFNFNIDNVKRNDAISQQGLDIVFNQMLSTLHNPHAPNSLNMKTYLSQIESLYQQQITKKTKITFNLKSSIPEGNVSADANVYWPDAGSKKPNWLLSPNLKANISIPIKLTQKKKFAKEKDQIAGFLEKKCISSKGGYYSTTLTYKNHELYMNGVSSDVCIGNDSDHQNGNPNATATARPVNSGHSADNPPELKTQD